METWATVGAKRARTAETPKLPSYDLRLRAPYFYPDGAAGKAANLVGCESPRRQLPDSDG
jgi:hypothetical protein